MCFHASRLEARQSKEGNIVLYDDQNRSLWDSSFVEKGFYYLQQASQWEVTSKYYIEASIAYWHTVDNDHADKWISILNLYDALQALDNSPIVALNRILAFSKVNGAREAITEAEKLALRTNHFYFLLLADLYKEIDLHQSLENYHAAFALCKTDKEKEMIQKKIREMKGKSTE
jgi:RNA polymerase sigma-70 factor (ECF subfamily)